MCTVRGNVRKLDISTNTFWILKQHDTDIKPKTSAAVNNFVIAKTMEDATSAVLNWLRPKHVVKLPVLMFQVVSEDRRRYKDTYWKEYSCWYVDIENNAYREIPLHYSSIMIEYKRMIVLTLVWQNMFKLTGEGKNSSSFPIGSGCIQNLFT